MKINKQTQLWEDLTTDESEEMLRWAEDVVLRGKIAHPIPDWLVLWLSEFNFDDRQYLLLMSTALPQKVLLSVLNAKQNIIFDNGIKLKLQEITILQTYGPDQIHFTFDGPTTYPEMQREHPEEGYDPELKVNLRKGYALEWLKLMGFDVSKVKIINTQNR